MSVNSATRSGFGQVLSINKFSENSLSIGNSTDIKENFLYLPLKRKTVISFVLQHKDKNKTKNSQVTDE